MSNLLHIEHSYDFNYMDALSVDEDREAEMLVQMREAQRNTYGIAL